MRKDVYDYFVNLRQQGLSEKNGYLVADNHIKFGPKQRLRPHVQLATIDGKKFYIKDGNDSKTIGGMVSADMYNSLGITTPPIELIQREIVTPNEGSKTVIKSIQQDVMSVKELICKLAIDDIDYVQGTSDNYNRYKWLVLYDSNTRRRFLKHMTPECLDKLISIFLLGELRTDNDLKRDNYFLCKSPNSSLWEDIIPIDLENMIIYNHDISSEEDFETFIYSPYSSATPHGKKDSRVYLDRINDMKELLEDGVLSPNNLRIMRDALNHDLPKAIKNKCKQYKLSKVQINLAHSPIARLWDRQREEFKDLLGL